MAFVLDTSVFPEAIRLKAQFVRAGLPELINQAMVGVALRSIKHMPAVPRVEISQQLRNVVATREYSKTGKKLKRAKVTYEANDSAMLIILARLWKKQGGAGSGRLGAIKSRQELLDLALKMSMARVRSGSFLKAGELAAALAFGGPQSTDGGETHLYQAKGEGILATLDHLVAEIRNDVPVEHWDATQGAAAYAQAERALQLGLDETEADLLVYVDRKLAEAGFSG